MYTYRDIWKISYPIIIGLVAQNIMFVIDTAFLGRVSEVTLGAAAIGGVFYLCVVMLGTGFAIGSQIMIGRRNGEKNFAEIGKVFDHTMVFLFFMAILLATLLYFSAPVILKMFISSPAVYHESLAFIQFRKFGLLFGFLVLGFNSLYVGKTKTKVLTLSTFIMASANIVLDYGLIFGNLGLPKMGIAGAALATNIAEFLAFCFYLFWTFGKGVHKQYNLFSFKGPDWILFSSLLNLSVPVMFQYFLSFSAWFVFFLVIEQIGETALAASNITRSVYMVFMIPVWGLSASVNTLVSNTIGKGEHEKVIPLVRKVFVIGAVINLVLIQSLLFFPESIISVYTNDPDLIKATVPFLRIISMALIAFSFGMIFFNALSGTGKTMLALKIEIVSIMIYLLISLIISKYLQAPAHLVWTVEILYFCMMGIGALLALKIGNWRETSI